MSRQSNSLSSYSKKNIQLCQLVSRLDLRNLDILFLAFSVLKEDYCKRKEEERKKAQLGSITHGMALLSNSLAEICER